MVEYYHSLYSFQHRLGLCDLAVKIKVLCAVCDHLIIGSVEVFLFNVKTKAV